MVRQITILFLSILILTACSSTSHPAAKKPVTNGGYLEGDGPATDSGINFDAIPDAIPRKEKLHRYANSPYVAAGKSYTPLVRTGDFRQRGIASWYGKKFHGQVTSSGEKYDMYAMTAAHPTLPIPSYARVTNLANQKSVTVRINDRGPFLHERVIDLSYTAAYKLGIVNNGSAEVEVESLDPDVVITPIPVSEPRQSTGLESVTLPIVEAAPVVVPSEVAAAPQATDSNIYLQLGAFKTQQNAEAYLAKMRSELSDTGKEFKLINKDGLVRIHIGPYATQAEARSSAESLAGKLGFKPVVIFPVQEHH